MNSGNCLRPLELVLKSVCEIVRDCVPHQSSRVRGGVFTQNDYPIMLAYQSAIPHCQTSCNLKASFNSCSWPLRLQLSTKIRSRTWFRCMNHTTTPWKCFIFTSPQTDLRHEDYVNKWQRVRNPVCPIYNLLIGFYSSQLVLRTFSSLELRLTQASLHLPATYGRLGQWLVHLVGLERFNRARKVQIWYDPYQRLKSRTGLHPKRFL